MRSHDYTRALAQTAVIYYTMHTNNIACREPHASISDSNSSFSARMGLARITLRMRTSPVCILGGRKKYAKR